MKKILISALFIPLVVIAAVNRKAAPNFVREDSGGAKLRLSDYKGKVVLLDFWATWCTGCKTEIPWYMEFADKYKNSGLAVIGVSMDADGWKVVKPFLAEKRLNYPVVIADKALTKHYGGLDSLPVTLLIDRRGRIASWHTGVVNRDQFEAELQGLLDHAR